MLAVICPCVTPAIQARQQHVVLVHSSLARGLQTELLDQCLAFVKAKHGVGVPNVNNQQHEDAPLVNQRGRSDKLRRNSSPKDRPSMLGCALATWAIGAEGGAGDVAMRAGALGSAGAATGTARATAT
jgi:hypothetical protein